MARIGRPPLKTTIAWAFSREFSTTSQRPTLKKKTSPATTSISAIAVAIGQIERRFGEREGESASTEGVIGERVHGIAAAPVGQCIQRQSRNRGRTPLGWHAFVLLLNTCRRMIVRIL